MHGEETYPSLLYVGKPFRFQGAENGCPCGQGIKKLNFCNKLHKSIPNGKMRFSYLHHRS